MDNRNKHTHLPTALCGLAALALLSTGCARRAQEQRVQAPAYSSVAYVQGQPVQHYSAGAPPVAAAPNYQDVQIVQHQRQSVPQVPNALGQETLSTGDRVTVVTYVHHYPQAVDTYPSVYWSGRWFYNVQGNFVFWDPFWSTWAYYWGPPRSLVMAWNFQYPWVAYSWGMGFYGPGWYWGGVGMSGMHRLQQPAPAGVAPAPLPAPRPRLNRATASRRVVPGRATHQSTPRPNPRLSTGRPNVTSTGRPNGSIPRPNRAIASARPNRAASSARPNGVVSSARPNRVVSSARPNGVIPRPKQAVMSSRGTAAPSYVQPSRSRTRTGSRTVRVYRPRPNYASSPRPARGSSWGGSSRGSSRPNFSRPAPSRAAPVRVSSPARSAPRPNRSSGRGTRGVTVRGSRPR